MAVSTRGHVGLNVSDLGRSVDFYVAVFGLEVRSRSDEPGRKYAMLGEQTQTVVTLWEQTSGQFSPDNAGLHHLSFQVETVGEVAAVTGRLHERGARIYHDDIVAHREGSPNGGVFFADPDGIRLEVYAPGAGVGRSAPTGEAPTCGFF